MPAAAAQRWPGKGQQQQTTAWRGPCGARVREQRGRVRDVREDDLGGDISETRQRGAPHVQNLRCIIPDFIV